MIRSISYSRYFRIATPMLTGSAAKPNQAKGITETRTVHTRLTTAPLISHFSCWRRSPEDRRQFSTWRPTKHSQNTANTRRSGPWTAPYQTGGLSGAETPPADGRVPAGRFVGGGQAAAGIDVDAVPDERSRGRHAQRDDGEYVEREVTPQHPPPPRGEPAVREEQDHQPEQQEARAPDLVEQHPHKTEGQAAPEAVVEECVEPAVGAEQEARGDREQEPAERVARLAAGHEQPHRRGPHG